MIATEGNWVRASATILVALGLVLSSVTSQAAQGTTIGIATFLAKGDAKEYKPGLMIWNGNFVGTSVMDSRSGPLHNAGWDCTGEVVIQDGKAYKAAGFCLVTDPDGDSINLLWDRQDVPGNAAIGNNIGTYLSGTGKYNGIRGQYKITCKTLGALATCTLNGGEYKVP